MARTRRAAFNYATSVFQTGITIIAGLWATPLLLRWLGEERYGAYRAAQDWLGYLGLLELGLGGALVALLAQGTANPRSVSRVLAAGIRGYAATAVAMFLAGMVLVAVVPSLIPVSPGLRLDLRLGFAISMAMALTLPLTSFRLLVEARQQSYLVNVLLALQVVCITLLSLLVARAGWGISGQFLAAFVGTLPATCLLTWKGVRAHPAVLGCFRRIRGRAEDRRLWRLNWPTLLHSLGGRISLFTDNAVIALLLSPRLVTPFFLTQRLALLVQGQLQGIGNATWAGLAELHARGQRAAFNDRLIELTKLVALFGVAIMLPIAALTGSFVSLWVGSAQFAGESIALLAAVNGVLLAIFSLWGWVFTGTGRIGALVPLQLIGAAINLACSVAATILVGAPGPLLGTLVMYVGYTGWKLPLLLRSHFGTPLQSLAIAVMGPIALGVPYAIALHVAEQRLSMDSWLALGTAAGASALAFLIIAWAAVLSGTERARWRERAAAVFATWTCPTPLRGPALMTTDRR